MTTAAFGQIAYFGNDDSYYGDSYGDYGAPYDGAYYGSYDSNYGSYDPSTYDLYGASSTARPFTGTTEGLPNYEYGDESEVIKEYGEDGKDYDAEPSMANDFVPGATPDYVEEPETQIEAPGANARLRPNVFDAFANSDYSASSLLSIIDNSAKVSHGIAISSDSKYAFISAEGIGGEPGKVDVIDLQKLELISSINVGKQAGGIAFWKITD